VPDLDPDLPYEDVLSVHEALVNIEAEHDRPARVVTLRFFGASRCRSRGDARHLAADGRARLALRALLAPGPARGAALVRWLTAAARRGSASCFELAVSLPEAERER
jgi:hypothetical protein